MISDVSGITVEPSTLACPRSRTAPMGWSHAGHVCQYVAASLIRESNPDKDGLLVADREIT
eukprot:6331189-Pyramimonas_sp.AAC.1